MVFDINYHELVNYLERVTKPENVTQDLITACNLPFKELCPSPHKTKRVVSTLSAAQGRACCLNSNSYELDLIKFDKKKPQPKGWGFDYNSRNI